MAGDEDEIDSVDGDEPMLDDHEPPSGKRLKKSPTPSVRVLFAEFRTRSEGLTGAEFDRELERFIERLVDRNVAKAPARIREDLRDTMRSYIENDPTLVSMVAELREASRR
jgi:hypothetical protein